MKRVPLVLARLILTGFNLLTALYCLLAYLPFTYHQIHVGGLIAWLDTFVRIHPWLNLGLLAVVAPLAIEPWKQGGWVRWAAAGFGAYQLGVACVLLVHPVLPGLENNATSFAWSLGALLPLAWLAVLDLAAYASKVQWTERLTGRSASCLAAGCGACFVSLLYAVIFFLRQPKGMALPEEAMAAGWSLLVHLLLFLGGFLVLEFLASLAGLFRQPAQVEFWLCHALLAGAIAWILRVVVWPALGFDGWPQILFSIVLGSILVLLNAGIAVSLAAGTPVTDGVAAAAAPLTLGLVRSWRSGAMALLVLALLGATLALKSAALDWNGLLQKLTAAGIWLGTFACAYTLGARRMRARGLAWLLAPLAVLAAYKGLEAAPTGSAPLLERWAAYDSSFGLARQFLAARPRGQASFFQFLSRNTNIAASVHVAPVSIELTPGLARSAGPLPHIFIFTIDSLRRDYLSPYNPAVRFTPSIEAFARESTVFQNAFTRYGATGLSEPAIWSGALLLHKQYITPFAPMNALEKLVTADQYKVMVSRDPILAALLTPSPGVVDLDPADAALTLEFSRTIDRLEQQIDRWAPSGQPLFAYTQPQNLHVSVIQREGASVPNGESYPGFYAPYASRVRRIDAALGKFIEFLKARGLYEHSILVLTADHGDSLGEDGRWGHAYTLFPEIVRIPLLIRLPEYLRTKVASDPGGLAFSTDITPSLYYLLGHRPIQQNRLFGSPLLTETPGERQRDPQAAYLLASSYGAVYGLLSGSGRRLYIADGVNYQNYRFDLNGLSAESRPVNAQFQREQEERIRSEILSINRFYRYGETEGGHP